MNKLIKEFAEKAGLNMHNDPIDGHSLNHELERFADLIVQECARIADTAEPFKTSDLIKQNFGHIK